MNQEHLPEKFAESGDIHSVALKIGFDAVPTRLFGKLENNPLLRFLIQNPEHFLGAGKNGCSNSLILNNPIEDPDLAFSLVNAPNLGWLIEIEKKGLLTDSDIWELVHEKKKQIEKKFLSKAKVDHIDLLSEKLQTEFYEESATIEPTAAIYEKVVKGGNRIIGSLHPHGMFHMKDVQTISHYARKGNEGALFFLIAHYENADLLDLGSEPELNQIKEIVEQIDFRNRKLKGEPLTIFNENGSYTELGSLAQDLLNAIDTYAATKDDRFDASAEISENPSESIGTEVGKTIFNAAIMGEGPLDDLLSGFDIEYSKDPADEENRIAISALEKNIEEGIREQRNAFPDIDFSTSEIVSKLLDIEIPNIDRNQLLEAIENNNLPEDNYIYLLTEALNLKTIPNQENYSDIEQQIIDAAKELNENGYFIFNVKVADADHSDGIHLIYGVDGAVEVCPEHGKKFEDKLSETNADLVSQLEAMNNEAKQSKRGQEPDIFDDLTGLIIPPGLSKFKIIKGPNEEGGIGIPNPGATEASGSVERTKETRGENRNRPWNLGVALPTLNGDYSNINNPFGAWVAGSRLRGSGSNGWFWRGNPVKRPDGIRNRAGSNGESEDKKQPPIPNGVSHFITIPKVDSASRPRRPQNPKDHLGSGENSTTRTEMDNTIKTSTKNQNIRIGSKLNEAFQKVENQASSNEIENKNQQERKEEEQRSDLSQNAAETADALGKEGGTKTIVSKTGEKIKIKLMNGTPPTTPRTVTNQARKKSSTKVIKSSTGEEIKLQMVGNGPQTQAPAKQRNLNSSAKKRTISAFNQQAASLQLSATNDALRIDEIRTSLQDAITYAKTPIAA